VIRQGGDGLDLLAVQRDDELLDRLGARRAVAGDDEVNRLLAALAAEVDDAMPAPAVLTAAPGSAPGHIADAGAGRRRRLGAAGVAAAVLLGGSVALGGAAAAVTGDPLAPYKTVGHAVGSVGSAVGDALSFGGDDLPEQAAPIAHLQKRLAGARAALAHGDTAQVQALVDELTAVLATADLSDEQRAALQQRLDKLQDSLARASSSSAERGRSADRATAAATPVPRDGTAKGGGGAKGTDPGEKEPKVTVTRDPERQDSAPADKDDKAPADKDPADKAPGDKAPEDKAADDETPDEDGGDTSEDTTSEPTQQQVPDPQSQVTAGSTAQRGQGASRR